MKTIKKYPYEYKCTVLIGKFLVDKKIRSPHFNPVDDIEIQINEYAKNNWRVIHIKHESDSYHVIFEREFDHSQEGELGDI